MNLTLVKILTATVFVNADETIEHVNNVLFISKIIRHRKSQDDDRSESQIFETEQKSDADDSSYFDSPFEE